MIRQIFIAVSAAGALAAVAAAPAYSAPEKREVTIGIPVKASTFLPIYIADEKKFFEKHGIKAKVVPFRGGSALVRAMIAGSVDIGITSLAGVTVGIKAGQDIKVFYGGFNMVLFDWYAVKGIKSIKDAKGKKFGISRYGSSTDFLTRYALKANGLDPKKDVQIIQGGGSSPRLAAMESGQLDEKKFFEKHGIKAKVVPFRGGSALVRAMIAGSVDIGITSLAGVTVGIKAGQDIKVFYGGFNMVLFDWYAVKGIKSIKDAKGKKFGISRYGSSTDFLTRYALKANGLDPKKDVQIIQGGGSSPRLAAMESGQLDVNILAPPFTMIAAKRGMPRILKQADLSADYPWHVFFATGAFLKKNPETTKAVLKGFVEGVRLMKSDKAFASKVLMKATKTKAEFAEPTVDLIKDYIFEDGRLPSDKGMKTFWDIGVDSGVYKSAWDKKRYWIGDFASTYSKWKP